MVVKTSVSYALLSSDNKLTEVKDMKKKKASVSYALRDKGKVKEYDTVVANLLPKIFKDDKLNNTVVKYYVTYNKDLDLNSKPLKYETKQGELKLKESVTKYLTENFAKFCLSNKKVNVKFYAVISYDDLNNYVTNNNECATKVKNAKIVKSKDSFIVQKEVKGTALDMNDIVSDLDEKNFPISLDTYYTQPKVTSDMLEDVCNTMNEYTTWYAKYKDGTTIKASVDDVSVNKHNEIVLNYDFLKDGLKEVAKSYNTVGKAQKFKTHGGNKITVGNTPSSTWGNVISEEKELEFLKHQFETKTSVDDRTPEYLRKQGKIGKTYVEVSISQQHIWVYKNGKCIMDSGVVTGTKGKHDTPKGLYYISECIPGKYLVGDGYKTWVNKWMRLTNQGVGLHDATWRSTFGGSIYTYSGSHGCINLPSSFASELFKVAYTGMPAIIY